MILFENLIVTYDSLPKIPVCLLKFIEVENPVTAANILNNNLGRIHSWACDW